MLLVGSESLLACEHSDYPVEDMAEVVKLLLPAPLVPLTNVDEVSPVVDSTALRAVLTTVDPPGLTVAVFFLPACVHIVERTNEHGLR